MDNEWNFKLSKTKKMEIELVCARNVIEHISIFTNQKHQGPSFTWEKYIGDMVTNCDLWMSMANVYQDNTPNNTKKMINECNGVLYTLFNAKPIKNIKGDI